MIRRQIFTFVALLGCLVPWATPGHFAEPRFLQVKEPMVLTWTDLHPDTPSRLSFDSLADGQQMSLAEK